MSRGLTRPSGLALSWAPRQETFACSCIWKLLPCAACETPTLVWALRCLKLIFWLQ